MTTKWKIILSIIHAVFLTVICYYIWNMPETFVGETYFLKLYHKVRHHLYGDNTDLSKTVLINTAYDKELVEVYDEYGITKGKLDITDRNKLLNLLQILEKSQSYKYIFLDIYFNPKYATAFDSLLFQTISSMPRVVVAQHCNEDSPNSILKNKMAYSDYTTTLNEADFFKYQFQQDYGPSMALFAYSELTGVKMNKCLWAYFYNGKLSNNCVILDLPFRPHEDYTDTGEKCFYHLGSDILSQYDTEQIESFIEGKYIIIGDLTENDMHETIVGAISGPIITYNAFISLMSNKHHVKWHILLIMFLIFFTVSVSIFLNINLYNYIIPSTIRQSEIIRFMFVWINLSTLFLALCFILYWITGKIFDVIIFATYFSILEHIKTFANSILKNKTK